MLAALLPFALSLALAQTPPAPPAPPAAPEPPASAEPEKVAPKAEKRVKTTNVEPDEPREEPILRGFERPSGKRFTGNFDDTEVDDAIAAIADAAGWSVVLPKGEHGTISARFKNVPAEEALRAVLAQASLEAAREGSIVTVRERSALLALPEGLSRDARRIAEKARREAARAAREVEREARRIERDARGKSGDDVVHGDVTIRAGEAARDVVAIQGSIHVEAGAEVRDAVAVLGSVNLDPGARAREAVAVMGDVRLGAGAEVAKDAVAVGGKVVRDPGAEVGGEAVSVGIPALTGLTGLPKVFGETRSPSFTFAQTLAKFAVFFALGALVLVLFPRRVTTVGASLTANPWKAVLAGFLGLILTPIVAVLLIATIIGIPLLPVAILLLVAAGILGFTSLALWIGKRLPLRGEPSGMLQLALGTAIVVLITAIPVLGGMACFAAALLTFGAVLRSRFGTQDPALPTTAIPPSAPPPAPAT